ncbi:MAG: helix-turn-helix transcriptional regulator [Bryobacterales bacterium]|nr:helix-turn-helix transcriptional regulator [Bryobacterales bacterium]
MKQAHDPEPYLPLRPNWFHIMAVLADGEQHGYAIMQQVQERTGGKVRLWPATLYGAIKKLLDEELITELFERPSAADDDARRRYYRLTPLGHAVLSAEVARLRELVRFAAAGVRKAEGNV